MAQEHAYSIGVEEEYFIFHARTRRAITRRDRRFLAGASRRLGAQVMPELLQSQIEAATPPCSTLREARDHLSGYRTALSEEAANRDLGIAAVGTFPLAFWREQTATPKPRYAALREDLQMLALRNMLCGMHVHVEVPEPSRRVPIMQRVVPYLPLFLALSTSSPFWEGHLTGLSGYRLTAYDELPRTGLPEMLPTQAEYDEYIAALTEAGVIPDASHIWWALRPSLRFPTLELRVADVCTRLDDALAIAALFRCLVRNFDRDKSEMPFLDRIGRGITAENKWRAQRHGVAATFVEPFRREAITCTEWLEQLLAQLAADGEALGCQSEFDHLRQIVMHGTSADEQVRVYQAAFANGATKTQALHAVVDWAARTTIKADAQNVAQAGFTTMPTER
jgi:carboxylate-amine ligase